MKKILLPLMLVLTLIAACDASPSSTATSDAVSFDDVRAQIEQMISSGDVPSMAVAVARDGEIIWEEGFGLADRENDRPSTEHTAYPLASISKALTATGLMVLVEQGSIDLDHPINDYLGEVSVQARVGDATQATVRRVSSHTAGLPLHAQHFYEGELYSPPSMEEAIRRYGFLITAPGERYQYSNLGYGILGHAISRMSGESYADFMHAAVFAPLGMDHTSVHTGPGLEENQAVKYTAEGFIVPPYTSDSPGASAIYGSAHDLIRFALFHLHSGLPDQKAILDHAAINATQQPSPETGPTRAWEIEGSGYGMGWFVSVTQDGLRVIHHSGGTLGVSTALALVPEENLAVVVLSNTDGPWSDAIMVEILCALLPCQAGDFLSPPDSGAGEPPFVPDPELIGLWEGSVHMYEGEIPLVLEIETSGAVHVTLGSQARVPLEDVSYQDSLPLFMNAGGGPFLRGRIPGELDTEDVNRGRPYALWIELKLREGVLGGSLVAFSQRAFYTGPLSHWVQLRRQLGGEE